MKSSRAMLLAAMLFAVPAFADETGTPAEAPKAQDAAPLANTPKAEEKKEVAQGEAKEEKKEVAQDQKEENKTSTTEDKKEEAKTETPSWFAAKLAVLTGFGTTVVNYTVAPIADWTTIPALKQLLRISYLKGGRFESSIPTVGKTMIAVAAAGAAYKVYQATQEQDETDEDDVFGE